MLRLDIKSRFAIVFVVLIAACWMIYRYPTNLGLDLKGGVRLILEAKDSPLVKVNEDAMLGVLSVIRNRVDGLGVAEPLIQRKGQHQISVELAGIQNTERARAMVGKTASLEFVRAEFAPDDARSLTPEKLQILAGPDARVVTYNQTDASEKRTVEHSIILKDTVLTGSDLKMANPATDQYGKPVVNIEFTDEGAKKFRDITAQSVGKPLAILLDGKVISAPRINEPIGGGKAVISGSFSIAQMRDMVVQLKAGALPVPVEIVNESVIGPTLGADSITKGMLAGKIGFALVVVFIIALFRIPGALASVGLVVYVILVVAVLKLCHATLTLPGIAGLILTIGIAVDANVIIFSRIREEKDNGHSLVDAIELGSSRAFLTVLDANVTTLIGSAVLFVLGTGPIRGFAITLGIGICVSMFTAIFVTRLLLDVAAQLWGESHAHLFFGKGPKP